MISCVLIHLADEDSVVKGEPGVNKPSFRRAGGGYAEIAGKYILVKTTTHPLYTMLTIDPKFGTSKDQDRAGQAATKVI